MTHGCIYDTHTGHHVSKLQCIRGVGGTFGRKPEFATEVIDLTWQFEKQGERPWMTSITT